jgi:hypothetical protein
MVSSRGLNKSRMTCQVSLTSLISDHGSLICNAPPFELSQFRNHILVNIGPVIVNSNPIVAPKALFHAYLIH